MNNSNDSWSRCAKEFPISTVNNNELQLASNSEESIMRPLHVKRLDFNNGFSSCRGLVATDIALANIEEIQRYELVTKWIADGLCTPPTSEQNTSCPSSPISVTFANKVERLEEESISSVIENLEKSPVIKCGKKFRVKSERPVLLDLTKSPVIGKRRRNSMDRKSPFGLWDKRRLDASRSSSPSDKSPILGKTLNSARKQRSRIKRKRFMDRLEFGNDSSTFSCYKDNEISSVLRSPKLEFGAKAPVGVKEEITPKADSLDLSQDIFSEEIITLSPKIGSKRSVGNQSLVRLANVKKEAEDSFCFHKEINEPLKTEDIKTEAGPELEQSHPYWENNGYCSPPVIRSDKKAERIFFGLKQAKGNKSFGSIIEDTEEFLLPEIQERSKEGDKLFILDSEFGIEKRKFVTDTERIDYDTSSENEGGNPGLKGERVNIITGAESDSDKTVSDIIEEPTTQDYSEPLKPQPIVAPHSGVASFCLRNSISATSPKISETVSPKDLVSPQRSIIDISVETTPPRTQESPPPAAELLDSGKKKKTRPKKGSLGARLQKLISGQVSCVRLWRHQMSRESAFERSSAPCTTLLVVQAWIEYGKNLYQTEVINDPYDLLNGRLDEFTQSKRREENFSKNLVVMTNPDFVGSVKLLPGTVFRIYLPWEIFNRNAGPGNLVLHALYFNVVSNPVKIESKPNAAESNAAKHSNELIDSEVIREYHCPCLESGKLDASCLNKFTDHKIDIIAEIIK